MTPIGMRIRELRTKLSLSQGDIERSTGMARAYISRVELGHTVPSVGSIKRFADAIGIPVHELFLEAPLEDRSHVWKDEGDSLVALLSSYVREMDPTRRRMLMRLALGDHLKTGQS